MQKFLLLLLKNYQNEISQESIIATIVLIYAWSSKDSNAAADVALVGKDKPQKFGSIRWFLGKCHILLSPVR